MELSQSEENYLKAIYSLTENNASLSTNSLSEKIQTKASSVTDMLKKLADIKLLNYEKYQGFSLNESGRIRALSIVRKHRIWETFLVGKLNFGWEEVHELAEQLEHIQSNQLIDKLDEFLGFPKFDPHGDPIPNTQGIIETNAKREILAQLEVQVPVSVIGVDDGDPEFLKYLNRIGMNLGTELKITEKLAFDHSIFVEMDGVSIHFSSIFANKITVFRL